MTERAPAPADPSSRPASGAGTVTHAEIAAALGISLRAVQKRAAFECWRYSVDPANDPRVRRYVPGDLPADVVAALVRGASAAPRVENDPEPAQDDPASAARWERFNAAPQASRELAQRRLDALNRVAKLKRAGNGLQAARTQAATELRRDGEPGASERSLRRLAERVKGIPRRDWITALLPDAPAGAERAEIHPELWEWFKVQYLSRKQPTLKGVYRRAREIAKARGWHLPSRWTFQRRLCEEVNPVELVAMREGREAAARLLPTQRRDTSQFRCGQAVNGDGLKFDRLWVRFPGMEPINTATAWFWQDVKSRRLLAWRLGPSEHTDIFRLATYDLTAVCAPEHLFLDNTRVAANRLMTGGAKGRNRFKKRTGEEKEALGYLPMLGMEVHFTNPDKETGNPGAKPIERAFGVGGLHEQVATHPRFAGRGYSRATAIDASELREVIAFEVARFNAKEGREIEGFAPGQSCDAVWKEQTQRHPPAILTEIQRRLFLLERERVRVDQSGVLTIKTGQSAHGRNRYVPADFARLACSYVHVYFDPDNLSQDVHVYSESGEFLCTAEHKPSAAFLDKEAAKAYARERKGHMRALKEAERRAKRMSEKEAALLYEETVMPPTPPEPTKSGNVVEGRFKRVPRPEPAAAPKSASAGASDGRFARIVERAHRAQLVERGLALPDDDL